MTAIAKYALIRDGRKTILHNNEGAYDVLSLSVVGPDLTVRFLDAHRDVYGRAEDWGREPDGWDVDAEGGLLVDVDRRTVLAFTIYTDVVERAAYLATVAHTWPDWQVRWAYDGVGDLMRYAGDGAHLDTTDRTADADDLELGHYVYGRYGPRRSLCRYLVTVTDADGGVTAHSVTYPAPWWVGEPLLGALGEASLVETCPTLPDAGLHLDLRTRSAWLWTCCRRLFGIRERWADLWPDWSLTFCEDRFGEQFERCADAVSLPVPSEAAGISGLRGKSELHWMSFVPDHPDRSSGYRAHDAIGRQLSLTRAEVDTLLATAWAPEARSADPGP